MPDWLQYTLFTIAILGISIYGFVSMWEATWPRDDDDDT